MLPRAGVLFRKLEAEQGKSEMRKTSIANAGQGTAEEKMAKLTYFEGVHTRKAALASRASYPRALPVHDFSGLPRPPLAFALLPNRTLSASNRILALAHPRSAILQD